MTVRSTNFMSGLMEEEAEKKNRGSKRGCNFKLLVLTVGGLAPAGDAGNGADEGIVSLGARGQTHGSDV